MFEHSTMQLPNIAIECGFIITMKPLSSPDKLTIVGLVEFVPHRIVPEQGENWIVYLWPSLESVYDVSTLQQKKH